MSDLVQIRKIVTIVEEIRHDGGPTPDRPVRRAACLAVIRNPYAGRYEPDITPLMEALKPLGMDMSQRLIAALGGDVTKIESYGKGSIIGLAGELEHGACWHVPGGYAMRELLGSAKAIVPSATKVGAAGARLDVALGHKDAAGGVDLLQRQFPALLVGNREGSKTGIGIHVAQHDLVGGKRRRQG
ncbi:MAG: amino acid synthesis family protein, partial [Alphaproteobacteria bacterium]|nr:amino acid synthesis family protein [Alphaproteobacteria bacterium]